VGTGPRGRVQLDDVRRAIDPSRAAAPAAQPLSPMRRALARAMTLSNATIPQFTVARSATGRNARWRREFVARLADGAPRLSVNDFLLQAVARSLIEFRALNAMFSGDPESADARILAASGAHIGLVIAVDNGLLVPVIHDVERLGLAEIARRRQDCVERGLKGRLKREEVEGATFSISILARTGRTLHGDHQSTAIRDTRGRSPRDCVVARDGAVVVRPAVGSHADG